MLKLLRRQSVGKFVDAEIRMLSLPAFCTAILALLGLFSFSTTARADCKFSSTSFPTFTPLTIDPEGLGLNGGSFIRHGNAMAAGHIDNLILYHAGSEIIPEITNIVYTKLNFDKMIAVYILDDQSVIRLSLNGVTAVPHLQLNVKASITSAQGVNIPFFMICN